MMGSEEQFENFEEQFEKFEEQFEKSEGLSKCINEEKLNIENMTKKQIANLIISKTVKDINTVKNFDIPKEELSEYWITYDDKVPKSIRDHVSWRVYTITSAKVYFLNETQAKIVL